MATDFKALGLADCVAGIYLKLCIILDYDYSYTTVHRDIYIFKFIIDSMA